MKNKISKIGAVLVLTVFLLSMVSVANAQPLGDRNQAAIQKYNDAKTEYLKARGSYKDARQDWITARNKYIRNKNAENLENALEKGRDFLLKADKTLVGYLKMVRAYVKGEPSLSETERQNILNELDSYITWLEQKQPEIEGATTKRELVDIAKTVRNKWQEIKPATKRIVGQIMNAKVLSLINKAETASDKVDNAIQKLQEQGKDTSALEARLSDFNTKIDLAKQKHQAAKEKYAKIKNVRDADRLFRQGNAFVKEANQYLRSAYKDLKEIVKELRKYKTITVAGTGRLTAEGNGKAYIAGNGTIDVSGSGVLTVTDNYGDMTVTVTGFGNKTEIEPNEWQYKGKGSAYVEGSDIIVVLEGQNIDLTAKGTGTATLTGRGTYETCGRKCLESSWTAEGVRIPVSAEVG